VVFPRGSQEYFLRTWLAKGGLEIGKRIALTSIPPQELVGRLRKDDIDGFCVAEPWNRRAAVSKLGRLVAQSGDLIPGLGEKVLGTKASWHAAHAAEHALIVKALRDAAAWMADGSNWQETAEMVASKKYVNTPISMVEGALREHPGAAGESSNPGGARMFGERVNFPARAHAAWYLEQMKLWGHDGDEPADASRLDKICLEEFFAEASAF
jgi:ABC-type nitrate/sulfonate/bicarbonate transport system substrate-binding protein